MLVDDPVTFAHAKFANMCAYLEAQEQLPASETAQLRAIPPIALYALLRTHLLPHKAAIEAGDVQSVVEALDDPRIAELARLCGEDAKILRYLKLFCELVA
jgi:hypothetical protein